MRPSAERSRTAMNHSSRLQPLRLRAATPRRPVRAACAQPRPARPRAPGRRAAPRRPGRNRRARPGEGPQHEPRPGPGGRVAGAGQRQRIGRRRAPGQHPRRPVAVRATSAVSVGLRPSTSRARSARPPSPPSSSGASVHTPRRGAGPCQAHRPARRNDTTTSAPRVVRPDGLQTGRGAGPPRGRRRARRGGRRRRGTGRRAALPGSGPRRAHDGSELTSAVRGSIRSTVHATHAGTASDDDQGDPQRPLRAPARGQPEQRS